MGHCVMGKLLTSEQIVKGLKHKRLYVVAERTGLSYPTVRKLADGDDENYTMKTVKRISDYITEIVDIKGIIRNRDITRW